MPGNIKTKRDKVSKLRRPRQRQRQRRRRQSLPFLTVAADPHQLLHECIVVVAHVQRCLPRSSVLRSAHGRHPHAGKPLRQLQHVCGPSVRPLVLGLPRHQRHHHVRHVRRAARLRHTRHRQPRPQQLRRRHVVRRAAGSHVRRLAVRRAVDDPHLRNGQLQKQAGDLVEQQAGQHRREERAAPVHHDVRRRRKPRAHAAQVEEQRRVRARHSLVSALAHEEQPLRTPRQRRLVRLVHGEGLRVRVADLVLPQHHAAVPQQQPDAQPRPPLDGRRGQHHVRQRQPQHVRDEHEPGVHVAVAQPRPAQHEVPQRPVRERERRRRRVPDVQVEQAHEVKRPLPHRPVRHLRQHPVPPRHDLRPLRARRRLVHGQAVLQQPDDVGRSPAPLAQVADHLPQVAHRRAAQARDDAAAAAAVVGDGQHYAHLAARGGDAHEQPFHGAAAREDQRPQLRLRRLRIRGGARHVCPTACVADAVCVCASLPSHAGGQ
eukprot:Rhum_TRINITY_DN14312_c18_g1::Rhum_TRINITY_DN14312_c18_g1_i1::g.79429::m.79429